MTSEGIFHDAHEVYTRNPADGIPDWVWQATFATKSLAAGYVNSQLFILASHPVLSAQEFEVRPV